MKLKFLVALALAAAATCLGQAVGGGGVPGAASGGSVTWPTSGDAVISNGTNSPTGLAPVNGNCLLGSGGAWTVGACGSGTVTSVSVTTANGVSGTVATATTTPAISLTLGAINPTSTGATTPGTGAFTKVSTNPWIVNPSGQLFYFEGSSITRAPHASGSPVGTQLPNGGLTGNYGSLVAASYWGSGNGTYYNDGVDGSTSTSMLARYTTGNSTYGVTVPSAHSLCAAATAASQRAFFFVDLTEVNNDQTNSIALATTISNLQAISADAMADGCFVVFLTSPDSNFANGFTVDQDVRNGTIASGNGTYPFVIDMASFIPNTLDTTYWDQTGPHPTVAGHKVMAADIVAYMTADGGYVNYSTPGVFAGPVQWNMYNRQLLYFDPANTGQIEIGSPLSNPAENVCFYQGNNGSTGNDNACINADFNQFNFNYFSGSFKFSAGGNMVFHLGDTGGSDKLQINNSSDAQVADIDSLGRGFFTGLTNTLMQGGTAGVVASATTIAPTTPLVEISGTTAIATITLPSGFTSGCFDILPTGTWTTTTAGNIFNAVTAVADVQYRACYWPVISKWVLK